MPQRHLVVPSTIQAELWWTVGGRITKNVIHGTVAAGYSTTVANANAMTTALNSLFNSSGLNAFFGSTSTGPNVHLRDIRDVGFSLVDTSIVGASGTGTGDLLPRQTAAVLTIRTGRAGRSFRGRMYIPAMLETANGPDNHIIAAAKTALDAYANGFIAAVNQNGFALGVMSRPLYNDDDTIRVQGFTTTAINVLCRDLVWDTQRRRAF